MSAFIVEPVQIDVIVSYFLTSAYDERLWYKLQSAYHYMGYAEAIAVAQALMIQNVRSVDVRYREENACGYHFTVRSQAPRVYTIGEIAALIDCLEYQSCETDDYYRSEAYGILSGMRKHLLRGMQHDADWTIDEVRAPYMSVGQSV